MVLRSFAGRALCASSSVARYASVLAVVREERALRREQTATRADSHRRTAKD
jgi:hypothetical protein